MTDELDARERAFHEWLLRDGPCPDEEGRRYVLSRKWDRRFEIVTWVVIAVAGVFLLAHVIAAVSR